MKKLVLLLFTLTLSGLAWTGEGEFDNYCATGLSRGGFHKTNCEISETYAGKKYCFSNEGSRDSFLFDPQAVVQQASKFYTTHKEPEREKLTQEQALAEISKRQCSLADKDVGYLNFKNMRLSHCNLINTSFFGANLIAADLSNADMRRSYLNLARLENANLSGADLSDAVIFQAIFDNTNFSGANLSNARLIGSLGKVNMRAADVRHGRLGLDIGNQPMGQMKFDSVGGDFSNANFEGADLNIASFRFGNLRGANLRNTNLHRADLIKADLTDADLTGADLSEAEVDDAIFTNVKGLNTVKGWQSIKGQCINCKRGH